MIDRLPLPDPSLRRPEGADAGWQDGITRTIDGHDHIFGCTYDSWCYRVAEHPECGIGCDCPCHNGSVLQGVSRG